MFWKIQEICNKMGTRTCRIVEEKAEIIKPKVGNPKNSVSRNWAILSYPWNLFFLRMRFSNFFLNYMVWKYQNEIAPIFYHGISTKTNEKYIKIPKLQPPDWKSPYWMTLYICQRQGNCAKNIFMIKCTEYVDLLSSSLRSQETFKTVAQSGTGFTSCILPSTMNDKNI